MPEKLVLEGDKKDVTPDAKDDRGRSGSKKGFKPRGGGKGNRRGNERRQKPGNDFTFWNEYPELMNIAANYPWMHIKGTPLEGYGINVQFRNVYHQTYAPVPGIQSKATDPLNLAFRQMYLDMHRKYRGLGAYQASDIGITVLCIDGVLQLIVEAERVYGILNSIPLKTRIQPDGLLLAMGYSAAFISDTKQNMADFRYGINRLISLARRLPLPKGMKFFANHVSLNGFVYADSKDERASILVFSPNSYFKYQTTGDTYAINSSGTAVLTYLTRAAWTSYKDMLTAVETELNTLMYDSDILKITSDFVACYGEENMQVLVDLPEDYQIHPTYDEAILNKWHNSERSGGTPNAYIAINSSTTQLASPRFCVYQQDDILYSLPVISGGSITWTANGTRFLPYGSVNPEHYNGRAHIVDTWNSDPSIETRCEAVLWKRAQTYMGAAASGCTVLSMCGLDVLGPLYINKVSGGTLASQSTQTDDVFAVAQQIPAITAASYLMNFDWAPFVCYTSGTLNGDNIYEIFGDTDNCSIVTNSTITKILDASLLSAFKVTAVGSK